MKPRFKGLKIILLLAVAVSFGYGFYYWYLNYSYSATPNIAIQKYIRRIDGPLYSYEIKILPTNIEDQHYGR